MSPLAHVIISFFLCLSFVSPCWADTSLRIATWNIAHLYETYSAGQSDYLRSEEDFERLAGYARELDADIVALQEVESEAVARRVFGEGYQYFFTTRNNRQRVGFAVRNTVPLPHPPMDVEEIGLPGRYLRYGLDLSVTVEGQVFRLLAVHLKSFCHGKPLTWDSKHCRRLATQVEPLEDWIDARAGEGIPMVILGDFNRRFDVEGSDDDGQWMWPMLDDNEPNGFGLVRVTRFRRSECWDGRYPLFIDHIILDDRAAEWVAPGSFRQVLYREDPALTKKLSDHCPIAIDLVIPSPPS